MGILDAAEQFTQKRFWEYFPESYDLGEALKSPKAIERTKGIDTLRRDGEVVLEILASPLVVILFAVVAVILLICRAIAPY